MSVSIPNVIKYFHDCYRSDNRELLIYDFLDRKVEDKVFFEGKEELLNGEYPKVPIDSEKAVDIIKKLEVFKKEKELLYGSFFVCGQYTDFKGETKRLCSPLFYYPAEVQSKDEYHYLVIKDDEQRINYPLISLLAKETDQNILSDPLFEKLPKDFIRFENIGSIVELCEKYFPKVDIENIYGYPDNITQKALKSTLSKLSKGDPSKAVLLPAGILGIVSKSTSTRGVLNELNELSGHSDYSTPLKSLFSKGLTMDVIRSNYKKQELPMLLSESQEAILKSSSINPLTLIVGPPGTGKSYTIGAIAIEHMNRGESVLIASRADEAVDVIVEKLKDQIGLDKCLVRAGKKRAYTTPLNKYLKALLTRTNSLGYLTKEFGLSQKTNEEELYENIKDLSASIDKRATFVNELETTFLKEVDNEIEWGKHLSQNKKWIWNKLKTQYLDVRNKFQTPIWEINQELFEKDQEQIVDVLSLIRLRYVAQVLAILAHNWNDIKHFHEALKLSSDTERLTKFSKINFKKVLKAFPIWLVNSTEVKDVLPFQKEMFDVLIVDEATQCDISSCIPLIQRAKRVVFAGDPNQLRHVSFLSKGIQQIFRNKYELSDMDESKLNYRDKSILDLVMNSLQSGDQVAMLDEHYRSILPIISFSSKQFYNNELRIMTARPDQKEQGVYMMSCAGKRLKNGSNEIEAAKLLADVKSLVDAERELSEKYCTSLGILSPFRAQVDLLAKMLIDEFSVIDIEKHNIRVGTAYSFQGEERDVMFLSFVLDKDSHHSALHHINKEDVFNVSITRARTKQFVYLSLTERDLKVNSLLRSYISTYSNGLEERSYDVLMHDKFLLEVKDVLSEWGVNLVWAGFSIAGLKVDLLLKNNDQYFGIDLVGYPGEFVGVFGIERYRILNRAGVKVFPLPYSDWYFENESTCTVLKEFVFSD